MCQNVKNNLKKFRKYLTTNRIDAYIIPNSDPHNSEYLTPHYQINQWLTGFSGSAATVIVSEWHRGLWTDSRYYLQAEEELEGTGIKLHKKGPPDNESPIDWLKSNSHKIRKLGLDFQMWTHREVAEIETALSPLCIDIVDLNPIDQIWLDRPDLPHMEIFIHALPYSERTARDKIDLVRKDLIKAEVDILVMNTLDDIAWLLNIRGFDNVNAPTVIAYCIINHNSVNLFIDRRKLNEESQKYLAENSISVQEYKDFHQFLKQLDGKIWLDKSQINSTIYQSLKVDKIWEDINPVTLLKSQKTNHELTNIEKAMIMDGAALVRAFMRLEYRLGRYPISEYEFANILQEERSKEVDYHSNSFDAIVGYGSNGAIVHYRPDEKKSAIIKAEGILLCDSGAQYLCGTTDITRTIKLGPVTHNMIDNFTLVMKGHIALATMVFPVGATGHQLDAMARQFLWSNGLDFGHGTGHGVGYFLDVHEGPHSISSSSGPAASTEIKAGMLTSNEPGYYETGSYGIRLENLVVAEHAKIQNFLKFRTVTLFPFDIELLNIDMMTDIETQWLNDYHSKVYTLLEPRLNDKEREWLERKCVPI